MVTKDQTAPTPDTWRQIIESAFTLFDDAEAKGFGRPDFSLGGGTVLMLNFKHRVSKDIDFFGYDVQWISIMSPRLNDVAAGLATDYVEQANSIKIVMPTGDLDFIVAADVIRPLRRTTTVVAGRDLGLDPPAEILAKKLFYRATHFMPRDVYDMSAAIDLMPEAASQAVLAARPRRDLLLRRLAELETIGQNSLLNGILPYDGTLRHAPDMVRKVKDFVVKVAGP